MKFKRDIKTQLRGQITPSHKNNPVRNESCTMNASVSQNRKSQSPPLINGNADFDVPQMSITYPFWMTQAAENGLLLNNQSSENLRQDERKRVKQADR